MYGTMVLNGSWESHKFIKYYFSLSLILVLLTRENQNILLESVTNVEDLFAQKKVVSKEVSKFQHPILP